MNQPNDRGGEGEKAAEAQKKIKGAISKLLDTMRPLPGRMSDVLEQHRGWQRVGAAVDPDLRSLEFLQHELSGMVESLHQLQSSELGPEYVDNDDFNKWLRALRLVPPSFNEFLDKSEQASQCGCHAQLHTAVANCFRRAAGLPLPFIPGVKDIEEELSLLTERPFTYRHPRLADGDTTSAQPRTDARDLVGIEDAMRSKEVRQFMDEGDECQNLRVISIVGPAGVGKTTLAQVIYSKLQERGHYSGTAWVVVSPRPDPKELLMSMLSQIRLPEITPSADEKELVQTIRAHLNDKRYIILIDDMWKESDWDVLKYAFPQNNRGSRIIVTTRLGSVAESCCLIDDYPLGDVHEVKPLCEEDSKILLLRRTFGAEVSYPNHLQKVCSDILTSCGGIPLFINGMANWLKEEGTDQKYLKLPAMPKEFDQILSPSYDNLPHGMKLPLLYSTMFPDGYTFEEKSFTQKLEAELLANSSTSAEDYFVTLLDMNVITRVRVEEAESCYWQVNYFMLQFLASKSADMCFVYTSDTLTSVAAGEEGGKKPRRLSFHKPDPELPALLAKMGLSHTRSLAVSGSVGEVPLDKFTCLMVLDLEGWQFFQEKNSWLSICKMYLLRHLSLRKTGVTGVPPSIENLCKLETLDLSHTNITELPSQVCELSGLRMFDLRGTQVTQLPEGIRKMRQLRRLLLGGNGAADSLVSSVTEVSEKISHHFDLDTRETKVPEEIGNLEALHTLAIDLSECSDGLVEALGCIWKLRVVSMTLSLRQSSDMKFLQQLCSSILKWKNLESLTIYTELGCSMEVLGSHLLTLPVSVKAFKVRRGRFFILPTWIGRLDSLAFIEINVYTLMPPEVSTLGKLRRLECLVLSLHLLPEEAIVIDGGTLFTKLQRLSISCRVPWVTLRKDAMPNLTYLELNIGGTPASVDRVPSGIVNLRSLSDVAINYNKCYDDNPSVRATVEAVSKEVDDHQRMINLVINGTIITSQQLYDIQAIEETCQTSATGNSSQT